MANLLLPVLLLGVMYFFLIVPQKKKQKAQADLMSSLGPGDEVITTGGIYGGVTEVDGDSVYLEIAPDIEIKIARRAIADRVFSATNPAPAPAAVPAGGIAGKLSSMFGGGSASAAPPAVPADAPVAADDATDVSEAADVADVADVAEAAEVADKGKS